MKKILIPLLSLFFLFSCEQEVVEPLADDTSSVKREQFLEGTAGCPPEVICDEPKPGEGGGGTASAWGDCNQGGGTKMYDDMVTFNLQYSKNSDGSMNITFNPTTISTIGLASQSVEYKNATYNARMKQIEMVAVIVVKTYSYPGSSNYYLHREFYQDIFSVCVPQWGGTITGSPNSCNVGFDETTRGAVEMAFGYHKDSNGNMIVEFDAYPSYQMDPEWEEVVINQELATYSNGVINFTVSGVHRFKEITLPYNEVVWSEDPFTYKLKYNTCYQYFF